MINKISFIFFVPKKDLHSLPYNLATMKAMSISYYHLCFNIPQIRCLQTTAFIQKHSTSLSKQSKVLQKLIGNRESGSKKRWFPSETSNTTQSQLTSIRDIGKSQNKQGKSASRRINVLNKLFMKHITDQLATGSVSDEIVGRGLEISRVKMTPDFNGVNVYWIAKGGSYSDIEIETILHRCSGILRHELSQLRLMGEVPRIYFVKDKLYANLADVDHILKNCDLEDTETEEHNLESLQVQEDLGIEKMTNMGNDLPAMRHDVFGLDHKEIMTGILSKLKKSKDAWETFEADSKSCGMSKTPKLDSLRDRLEEAQFNEEKLKKYLSKRNQKPQAPDRKKPLHIYDDGEHETYYELYNTTNKEDVDYIDDEKKFR